MIRSVSVWAENPLSDDGFLGAVIEADYSLTQKTTTEDFSNGTS